MKLIIPLSIVIVCLSILAVAHNSSDYAPIQAKPLPTLNTEADCLRIPKEYQTYCLKDVRHSRGEL